MVSYQVDPDVVGGNGDGDGWANAHPSLADWDADNAQDLTSLEDSLEAECRGVTNADTTAVAIGSDWESSATYFIQIRATSGHLALKTGWSDSRYRLVVTDSSAIVCQPWSGSTHFKVIGLQIRREYSSATYSQAILIGGGLQAGDTFDLDGCRIEVDQDTLIAVRISDSDAILYLYNCVIGGKDNTDSARYGVTVTEGTMYAYNCCFLNCEYGFHVGSGDTGVVKNCIFAGNDDDILNSGTITVEYNCADDDLDTEFSESTNVQHSGGDPDNEIADYTSGDCTLQTGGNAENAGVDNPSSGRYSTDMEGDSYTSTWSMGVDEPAGVANITINHTKVNVELTNGTHETSIDKIINHSKNSVEVTSKSHTVAIGQIINHVKSVVEAITKTHDQIIGVVVNHSKSIAEATAGSHNILIDLIVSHSKATVNTTIGSHTPTLGTIISHVKETVEATIKNHSVSIDQIIIHVKTNVETLPGNHSVTSGVLFQHTKENVEATAGTHLLSIDQIVNHVKGIIEVIPGSHIAVLGIRVPHVKSDIEVTPKSHNIITGTIVNHIVSAVEALRKTHSVSITSGNIEVLHTKETVLATSQTHTPIIDQIINHIKQQVELQAGFHFPVIDQIINHSTGQVLATTGVHSIALAVLYNHSVNQVNVLPGSHEALVDVLINHIASQVLATVGSHTIDATAIILTPEGRIFTVWVEDRSWSAYSENRTLQISKSYRGAIL